MDLDYIVETLEPKRDKLFEQNLHIKKQIEMFSEIVEKHKKDYEQNLNKIKQLDFILDNYVYKKEPF